MGISIQEQVQKTLNEKIDRRILLYLNMCARCGVCKDACHVYKATGEPKHMPTYRAEVLRRVYKGQQGGLSRWIPWFFNAKKIDEELLDELYQVAYTCTGCRRCMVYCPYGIDITAILGVAKALLVKTGKAPEVLEMLTDAAIEKGKSIGDFKDFFKEQIQSIESQVKELSGLPEATIPVEDKGADILYVALAGTHSILPAAVVFNLAKESWTLSLFEGANYGYFLGDTDRAAQVAERIVAEAKALGVKEVVITECGHTYRVMKYLDETWSKQKFPFKVTNILELFARYLKEGRLRLDSSRINVPVTYHDPCQIGRNGGVFEEPRMVVQALAEDFREMTPDRGKNWCCGGGGGLVAQMELEEYRAVTGKVKAEQIATTGAKIIATPCENCRLQLALLNEKYHLQVEICSVMDLVLRALADTSDKNN